MAVPCKVKGDRRAFDRELNSLRMERWGCDTAAGETLLAPSQASLLFDYIPMGCLGSLNTIQDFKGKEGSARDSARRKFTVRWAEKENRHQAKPTFYCIWIHQLWTL